MLKEGQSSRYVPGPERGKAVHCRGKEMVVGSIVGSIALEWEGMTDVRSGGDRR